MNPWPRRFECHYNQRYYVWLAKWYWLATALFEGSIAIGSSATVYLWLQSTHSDWAGLLAITAAILSIVVMTGRLPQRAGRFDGQAKPWTRRMLAWDGLAQRTDSDRPPKAHELQAAEREFLHLFEQEPRVPWPFVQRMFYARVERELGCA